MADIVPEKNVPFAKQNFDDRIKLVEASFKTVLDSDLHEDDKAGRILSAIAFLTAAAAAVFGAAGNLQKTPSTIFGLNASVIAFSAYLFFVLVGAALYLGALGPSFNRPSWFQSRSQRVYSLLFFQNIGALDEKAWSDYWLNDERTLAELQDLMVKNYIDEGRLIAQKLQAKVTLMSLGSLSFRVAILFFVVLMATLFSPDSGVVWLVFLLGLFGLFYSFAFVSRTLPKQESQQPLQVSGWQTILSAITTTLRLTQKSNTEKLPWQTVFLASVAVLSLISFLLLLVVKLIIFIFIR